MTGLAPLFRWAYGMGVDDMWVLSVSEFDRHRKFAEQLLALQARGGGVIDVG